MDDRETHGPDAPDAVRPAAALTDLEIRPRARRAGTPPRAQEEPAPNQTSKNGPVLDEPHGTVTGTPQASGAPTIEATAIHEPATPDVVANVAPDVAPAAIIDLWEHLAADRLRPRMSDMDPVAIARQWPNSLLLRVIGQGRRPDLEVAHMFAPTAGGPTPAIPIDAMTVDWIVGLGREVVATGAPVHETDAVPTSGGAIDCGVIALPFGPEADVDHVLCHLYRANDRLIEGAAIPDTRHTPRDRSGIKRLFGR